MSQVVGRFTINVEQIDGFEFRVRFDKDRYAAVTLDEPPPLGHDSAPNAARFLAAAIGDCLSASLVFCMKKAGVRLEGLTSEVTTELVRNDDKRLRVGRVDVVLRPRAPRGSSELASCLASFEDFCVVTQSVRDGLDVRVRVALDEEAAQVAD